MQLDITKTEKQYEAEVEGKTAFISYIDAKGRIYLTHTEVPAGLEGKGIGSGLVSGVLSMIEEEGKVLFPLCPFVASYLRRHPEWKRVLAPGVNV